MSWTKLAAAAASTKRASVSGGKRGAPTPHLTGLSCTPLVPADGGRVGELLQRLKLDTPNTIYDCFIVGNQDIRQGDTLSVSGQDFIIRAAAPWPDFGGVGAYMHVTVEKLEA